MTCIAPMISLAGNTGDDFCELGEARRMSTTSSANAAGIPVKLHSQLLAEDPDLRDIVEEFVAGLDERLSEMRDAHAKLDFAALRTLAHRLKGAGGSYGYPDLSKIAAAMEEEFKQFQAANFEQEIQALSGLVQAAKAGLK